LGEYDKQPEPSESLSSIPEDVMCQVLTAFLDGPSWTCLCQVSRRFSELAHNGSDEIDSRIWGFVMNKFDDLICDIREMAVAAETYAEVCDGCRAMVDDVIDLGMDDDDDDDDFYQDAHVKLFDRVLGRATDTIAYSVYSTLEGAGSEDFFRVWSLVEAEAY